MLLHTHIGGTVRVSAVGASSPLLTARVVGRAVLAPAEVTGHIGVGAVLAPGGLLHFASGATTTPPFVMAVKFRGGMDSAGAFRYLTDRLSKVDSGFEGNVTFGQVTYLPFALGELLAALALVTLVHLLVTSIRRRRRDLASLKTLHAGSRWTDAGDLFAPSIGTRAIPLAVATTIHIRRRRPHLRPRKPRNQGAVNRRREVFFPVVAVVFPLLATGTIIESGASDFNAEDFLFP